MNLSVKHLRAFMALSMQRNFTKAAHTCHLSQPAFSALIQALEEDVGVRLFDRTTRRVELTHEGRLFEPAAQRLMADFESAYGDLRQHADLRCGRISIAALPSLAAGFLPSILAPFKRSHPGIEISVFDSPSDTCIALVRSNRVDLALASAPIAIPGVATESFCTDSFHVVCAASHPLAATRSVRPAALAGSDFIHLTRNTSIRQQLEFSLHPLGLQSTIEVEHLATVAALVKAGLGISVIPTLALFQFDDSGIAIRPLVLPGLTRHIHIVRSEGRPNSVAADAFLQLVRSARPGFLSHAKQIGKARPMAKARKK